MKNLKITSAVFILALAMCAAPVVEAFATPGVHQTGTPVRTSNPPAPAPSTGTGGTGGSGSGSPVDNGISTATDADHDLSAGTTVHTNIPSQCATTDNTNKDKECICVGHYRTGAYATSTNRGKAVLVGKNDSTGTRRCWYTCETYANAMWTHSQTQCGPSGQFDSVTCTPTDPPPPGGGGGGKQGIAQSPCSIGDLFENESVDVFHAD